MSYQPFKATVVFTKIGEPEIVAQEDFPCQRMYPAEAWASAVVRCRRGSDWLRNEIQIITVTYWYTWREDQTFEDPHD